MTWCFEPFLRRSVGFGPVFFPRVARGGTHCQRPPSGGQADHAGGVRRAALPAGAARLRRAAIGPAAANSCFRTRSPFLLGASATESHFAARTGCLSGPLDLKWGAGPSAYGATSAATLRSGPTNHRRATDWICAWPTVPSPPLTYKGSVKGLLKRTLNGITPSERRVTNDDAANPRTTLTCGLCAPVPVRSRFPEARDHTGDRATPQFLG